jgi:hypothetical protein
VTFMARVQNMCSFEANDRYGTIAMPQRRDRRLGEDMMKRRLKNKLWMSVAVVAVLAGVTAAAVMAAQPATTHHHHHHRKGGMLAAAASYLGSSPAQLKSELRSGKSLAEIANATSGKSSQGLIEALETADKQKLAAVAASLPARITAKVDRPGAGISAGKKAQLAKEVQAGSITQAQANARLSKLASRVAARVNRIKRKRGSQAKAAARKRQRLSLTAP